ncbi:MAG TPA: hypothetical protein VKB79_08080 [Bryobacteraceae bacterium]|nr:hypothetical protein [Bryobacteraceae bacterium]
MRIRTTKKLGQRVDRSYVRELFPIPLWRRILTAGALTIALAWLGLYAIARNQTPYTAGPLTQAHAFLGKQCATCHGSSAGIAKQVADQRCAACHDAPIHNLEQAKTPVCVDCHVDHRGELRLAGLDDRSCISCHSDLHTRSGRITVATQIGSFAEHPEFAAIQAGRDTVGLRFNHAKHVTELSQKCGDCHTPVPLGGKAPPRAKVSDRALMSVPTYAGTCMPCHALNFDDKIPDAAPHDKPAVVDQFVTQALAKYIAAHPGDLGKEGAPGTPAAWVKFRIDADEKQLWEVTCARCHAMGAADASGLPVVADATPRARWFSRATFDHAAHQGLTCASCHPNAAKSTAASDLLLPGIETCRSCHNSGKASAGRSCATCHVYHDWSKTKGVDGKYTIDKLTKLIPPPSIF